VLKEEKLLVAKTASVTEHVSSHPHSHAGVYVSLQLRLGRSPCKWHEQKDRSSSGSNGTIKRSAWKECYS